VLPSGRHLDETTAFERFSMFNSSFDLFQGIIVGTADSKAEGMVMRLNRDLEELQSQQLPPPPRTTSSPEGQVDVMRLAQNLASELLEHVSAMSQEEFEDFAEEEEKGISCPEPLTDSSDPVITVAPSGVEGQGVCSSRSIENLYVTVATVAMRNQENDVTSASWLLLEYDPRVQADDCDSVPWVCTQALRQSGSVENSLG
jgi:hypothetical protein